MEVVHARCCGIDVHQTSLAVCFPEQFLIRPSRLRRLSPTPPLPEHVSGVRSLL